MLITAVWAYCTFCACFCFLFMAGRTEKPVNLSLSLSGSPLPPDNVLPMQGVTSLADCHMTAPIKGLKGWHSPGRGQELSNRWVATTALKVPLWAADQYLARASDPALGSQHGQKWGCRSFSLCLNHKTTVAVGRGTWT